MLARARKTGKADSKHYDRQPAKSPSRRLCGVTGREVAELIGTQPLLPNQEEVVRCRAVLPVKLAWKCSHRREPARGDADRVGICGQDTRDFTRTVPFLLSVCSTILIARFALLRALLTIKPKRIVEIDRIPTRISVEIQPPRQPDRVFLREIDRSERDRASVAPEIDLRSWCR
jgi:hypothetical protein